MRRVLLVYNEYKLHKSVCAQTNREDFFMELMEYEKKHTEAVKGSLAECTVLLKKDGKFPLEAAGKIAAFGSGVRLTVKGGTGSGEVNSHYSVNIEEGLEQAGFEITTKAWLDAYDAKRAEAKTDFIKRMKAEAKANHQNVMVYAMGKSMPEPNYQIPLEGQGNVAIYVLSRISGEGNDRPVEEGEIKLSATEKRDILALNEKYDKFMLVLNVGGVVDLSDVTEVKNILVLSQLGVDTGTALVDILLGRQNPSGKLATTWAAWDQYAPMDDFEDINDTRYQEGIYVGYRYFDSFHKKALFPFGYGLSYTEFAHKLSGVSADGEKITVRAQVTNTGQRAGKQVVQVYVSAPSVKLDKAYQDLCGFAKTKELASGESQEVAITFALSDFASYDETSASYILEAGNYIVRMGVSSQDTAPVALLRLQEDVTTLVAKNVLGDPGFTDLRAEAGQTENIPADICVITLSADDFTTEQVDYQPKYEILPEVEALSIDEASLMNIGGHDPNKGGLVSIIGSAGSQVCGAAGETTTHVKDFPSLVMADGPAGLRLAREYYRDEKGLHAVGQAGIPESFMDYMPKPMLFFSKLIMGGNKGPKAGTEVKTQYCTAIPIGTAIAQSFNTDLAEKYGDIVGYEMEMFGVHLWLAPALNIHRSIRCGRNFEYYSEDPLVSGLVAAGITNGVQKHPGCGTTIKHYAANNKELNRYANNSHVSERAMREIYTKGFGICVKKSQPHAVMTSYNLLNGVHTAENRGLIEDILRCEYGYEGIVMTDWVVPMTADKRSANRNSLARFVAAAGGDLFMPGGKSDYEDLKKGIQEGDVSEEQVRINATRVLKMARKLVEK